MRGRPPPEPGRRCCCGCIISCCGTDKSCQSAGNHCHRTSARGADGGTDHQAGPGLCSTAVAKVNWPWGIALLLSDPPALDHLPGLAGALASRWLGLASAVGIAFAVSADISVPMAAFGLANHHLELLFGLVRRCYFGAAGAERGPAAP